MKKTSPEDAQKRLREVIDALLGPDGCPWDKEQTPLSLCDYLIEECFELVDAIRSGDKQEAMEEVGDVAFLLLFISHLYNKEGAFSYADALEHNAAKMIRRHPHVFADAAFEDQEELLKNWERIKRSEKDSEEKKTTYATLPKGLPPLLRAYRIHSKAARVGFTWNNDEDVLKQVEAEKKEFEEALKQGTPEQQAEEFGDYIFTLVEYGRRQGIKANAALDFANRKFLNRFGKMEQLAIKKGLDFPSLSFEEQDALWDEVKENSSK